MEKKWEKGNNFISYFKLITIWVGKLRFWLSKMKTVVCIGYIDTWKKKKRKNKKTFFLYSRMLIKRKFFCCCCHFSPEKNILNPIIFGKVSLRRSHCVWRPVFMRRFSGEGSWKKERAKQVSGLATCFLISRNCSDA